MTGGEAGGRGEAESGARLNQRDLAFRANDRARTANGKRVRSLPLSPLPLPSLPLSLSLSLFLGARVLPARGRRRG